MVCKLGDDWMNFIGSSCFILTMWYVNTLTNDKGAKNEDMFYINYVVCKL